MSNNLQEKFLVKMQTRLAVINYNISKMVEFSEINNTDETELFILRLRRELLSLEENLLEIRTLMFLAEKEIKNNKE